MDRETTVDETTAEDVTIAAAEEPQGTDELAEWKSNARKWERRAKENADAAEELKRLKREQMDDLTRITAERDEAVGALEELRGALTRREWVDAVSAETGVPAQVLLRVTAADIDELRETARLIAGATKPDGLPTIPGDGTHATDVRPVPTPDDWFRDALTNR